jgi:hypothetical protein
LHDKLTRWRKEGRTLEVLVVGGISNDDPRDEGAKSVSNCDIDYPRCDENVSIGHKSGEISINDLWARPKPVIDSEFTVPPHKVRPDDGEVCRSEGEG